MNSRDAVNLTQKFGQIHEYTSPKILAELNDTHVKAVKLKGEFVWHHHDNEDELFWVTKGTLHIKLRDPEERTVTINPGEFFVVPKKIEHCPFADEETEIILIEPKGTLNTGNTRGEKTREAEWI
jgi:mannose-6-phosphate isomerase-like protein (cupin superfamily)